MEILNILAHRLTRFDIFFIICILVWVVLKWNDLLPEIENVQKVVDLVNHRSGFLLVLLSVSVYYFNWSIKLFFVAIDLIHKGQDTQGIVTLMINYVTGQAFGGAWGAFLASATGTNPTAPPGEKPLIPPSAPTPVSAPPLVPPETK